MLAKSIKGIIVAVALSALGCVTEGRDFPSTFGWIKKGTTKQEDMRMILGDPQRVGNTDGTPTWTYGYYKYKLIGKSTTKELKVYWTPSKTVDSFSFNSSFPEDVSASRGTVPASPPPRN